MFGTRTRFCEAGSSTAACGDRCCTPPNSDGPLHAAAQHSTPRCSRRNPTSDDLFVWRALCHAFSAEMDAAFRWPIDRADDVEQRRLTATGRAEEHHKLTPSDR